MDQNVCSSSTSDPHFTPLRLLEQPTTNDLAAAWSLSCTPSLLGFMAPVPGVDAGPGWGGTGVPVCTLALMAARSRLTKQFSRKYLYCSVPSLS